MGGTMGLVEAPTWVDEKRQRNDVLYTGFPTLHSKFLGVYLPYYLWALKPAFFIMGFGVQRCIYIYIYLIYLDV